MTCTEYQLFISKLLDNELRQNESSVLFTHLSTCEECRGFFHECIVLNASFDAGSRSLLAESEGKETRISDTKSLWMMSEKGSSFSLRPRISTLALLFLISLIVGLLFSVSVTYSRNPQNSLDNADPSALLRQ